MPHDVEAPNVFPIVAIVMSQIGLEAVVKVKSKAASELPGKIVADKNADTKSPNAVST
jgi:hypothetical protein